MWNFFLFIALKIESMVKIFSKKAKRASWFIGKFRYTFEKYFLKSFFILEIIEIDMEGMEQSPSHITKEPEDELDNSPQSTSTTYEVNGEIISLPPSTTLEVNGKQIRLVGN